MTDKPPLDDYDPDLPRAEGWNGDCLRIRRTMARLSIVRLSDLLWEELGFDISRSSLYRHELNQRIPSVRCVEALAQVLHCSPEDFCGDVEIHVAPPDSASHDDA